MTTMPGLPHKTSQVEPLPMGGPVLWLIVELKRRRAQRAKSVR